MTANSREPAPLLGSNRRPTLATAALLVALGCVLYAIATLVGEERSARSAGEVALTLSVTGAESVSIEEMQDGSYRYALRDAEGALRHLSSNDFAKLYYRQQSARTWWMQLLNVHSAAGVTWVAVGMLGQLLFTGRMLLQWLASERVEESVVPVAFWWLSLGGASMLMIYFLWRRDIVGILGQGAGWLIYSRNLVLIHRPRTTAHSVG